MALVCRRGWIALILCGISLLAAIGQPPPRDFGDEDDPNLPPFKSTTERAIIPFVTANELLRWTAAPTGAGEFLLSVQPHEPRVTIGTLTLVPTNLGLLRMVDEQSVALVPGLFGRQVFIFGEAEGKIWVQDTAGQMYGLNRETLAIETKVNGLGGACIGVLPDAIWCLDSYTANDNERRFPYGTSALIEYDRTGKERRQVKLADAAPADFQILLAKIDGAQIWVATSNGDASCIHRVDITTGAIQTVKAERVQLPIFLLNDRLVWLDMHNGKHATVFQLDKATLQASSIGKLPTKYVGHAYDNETKILVTDEYIWCQGAVFSSKDCRRIRAQQAGTPPELPAQTRRNSEEEMLHIAGYTFLGADAERAWLGCEGMLAEVHNDGTLVTRDLKAMQLPRLPVGVTAMTGSVVVSDEEHTRLYRVHSDEDTVQIAVPNDQLTTGLATEKRLWFANHRRLVTCGPEMQLRKMVNPTPQRLDLRQALAVGDELYLFGPEQRFWRINGATGTLLNIESWEALLPEEERAKLRLQTAYPLANGRLLFLFTQGRPRHNEEDEGDEEAPADAKAPVVLLAYDPATDQWQRLQVPDKTPAILTVVNTARGMIGVSPNGRSLYRAGETGWEPLGTLPLATSTMSLAGGTDRYLYLQSPIGLYRLRWDELTPVDALKQGG